jgi:hypothetical protein
MRCDVLDKIDGQLYIKNTDVFHDQPIRRMLWWPITRASGYLPCWFVPESTGEYCQQCGQRKDGIIHNLTPSALQLGGHDGRYRGQLANGVTYQVEIDPRAQAVKIEEQPIPCPKVRAGIETRFYRGTWQKYLKTSGWKTL